ncbi:CHAT domain-containing protein [Roseomonas eburnea]|uniref:CHAT domain-containing protein n=1 Tax=Neoroseomonas eburnea TaxID=1346889 RepID=A0A9X9XFX4_9PROT|nr:CHAT domain-containing protein [Neoroseomonas eburnea]MBR0682610.1 CHAT domain-containing protein [Neoroseomonas eburnea]
MRACFRSAALALLLAGCVRPPPEAYVPGGSSATAATAVAIGSNARGEACRMLRSGGGAEVFCGAWESPSARVRQVAGAPVPELAARATTAQAGRMSCDAPTPTTVLGGQPAAVMNCRRHVGGWPAFALVATAGGNAYEADGVLPALPAAERAIGILAGLASPEGALPPSAALDMMAARLSREAFGANDLARFEQLMTLGREANQAERFVAAETAYRAALGAQERMLGAGAPDSFGPMIRLALQLSNQGRHPEAEALFARAAPLAGRASDPLARAQLQHYRGLHEANRRQAEAALAAFGQAEALYGREVPPELRSGGAGSRAATLATGANIVDPLAARAVVGMVEVRRNRAAVLRSEGRIAEAEAASAAAAQLAAVAPGLPGADLIAARVARTTGAAADSAGAPARARGEFTRAAARFARGAPRSRPYADTLLLEAAAAADAGAPAGAILNVCRQATAVLRELREGTTAQSIAPCVDAFARSAGGDSQTLLAEAFEAAQLAQGSITTTQIARAAARLSESARNPAAGAAIRQRDEAGRRLATLYRARDEASVAAGRGGGPSVQDLDSQISEAQEALIEADQAAQTAAPGFAQLLQSVASASEVFAMLEPGEALASVFLPPEGAGWSFVLRDGRIAAGPIGGTGTQMDALVQRLRASLEDGNGEKPFDAAAAHGIYRALFAEVAGPLAGARRLIVAPSGQLLSVPFGVLVDTPPPAPTGHEGVSFLLARLPIGHVPAPASFVALRRAGPSRASQPWFGFGAPLPVPVAQAARTFPASAQCGRLLAALPALPTAGLELQASGQLMGARPGDQRTGRAFTADTVRRASLRDFRVLHFATHGLLPGELSCLQEAAIVASPSPGAPDATNALLLAGTLLDIELDADVVVLSACNSGGGGAGESLSGLARSIFFAGARSLLVTHWYINDAAATRIVAYSLRNLQQGQGMIEALRSAQLDLARNVAGGSHPALWGGFGLVGPGPSGRAGQTASAGPSGG